MKKIVAVSLNTVLYWIYKICELYVYWYQKDVVQDKDKRR